MHLKNPYVQNLFIRPMLFIVVFMLTIGNPQMVPQVWAQSAPPIVIDVRISSSGDDAEEGASGSIYLTSSYLEMGEYYGFRTIGLRYPNLNIPQGAQITNAYIEFKAKNNYSRTTSLDIRAEASGDAPAFNYTTNNLTTRDVTTATVNWNPGTWSDGEVSSDTTTPDLSSVIQEVVDRGDWTSGNAVTFFVSGSGLRRAYTYNVNPAYAALLHIEYEEPASGSGSLGPIDPLPQVTGTPAGYLAGNFGVNEGGSASYSMELSTPPGTSGVAPKLSLSYDSRGRSSVLGTGWSLTGLSSITRCGTTLSQDGFIDGVDFDSNDKFCLDGQRLVAYNGTYGANGTEYRTENESFAQIFSYGTAGNGPERFVVKTKSGLIYSYGATADSRVEAQGRTDAMLWHADKIEDTVGNYMTITYHEDNTIGESYPLRIDYTGNTAESLTPYNSVQFSYESRNDDTPRFLAGSKMQLTKRLNKISMYTDQDLAWEYNLTYDPNNDVRSSRLISVEECDGENNCLAPTTFAWQSGQEEMDDQTVWFPTSSNDWIQHAFIGKTITIVVMCIRCLVT